MRECGECTACCEGWLLDKKMKLTPGSACEHCAGGGCAIYETRPEIPCRSFRCAWLDGEDEFDDDLRPDKSGAIIMKDRDWQGWKTLRAVPCGETMPPDTLERLRVYAKSQRLPLIFMTREMKDGRMVREYEQALGPPEFAEAVKRAITVDDVWTGMAPPK